jgi:hypothetical protein
VILNIARVNHTLENYGIVKTYYEKLMAVNPELAVKFSYLRLRGEEAHRAADVVGIGNEIIWEEE